VLIKEKRQPATKEKMLMTNMRGGKATKVNNLVPFASSRNKSNTSNMKIFNMHILFFHLDQPKLLNNA